MIVHEQQNPDSTIKVQVDASPTHPDMPAAILIEAETIHDTEERLITVCFPLDLDDADWLIDALHIAIQMAEVDDAQFVQPQ